MAIGRRRRRKWKPDFSLNPETSRGIFTVFLFLAAFNILLAIFGFAGRVGEAVDGVVTLVFGWDKLFVPFVLFVWAYHLFRPEKLPLNASNFIGFILLFVGLNGLVHAASFGTGAGEVTDEALASAGGRLGALLANPALQFLGFAGAVIVFGALFIVSWLLMFNTSLQSIAEFLLAIGRGVAWAARQAARPVLWLLRPRQRDTEPSRDEEFDRGAPEDMSAEEDTASEEDEEEEEEEESAETPGVVHAESAPPKKARKRRPRIEIPFDLLMRRDDQPTSGDLERNKEVIRKTLENFGIMVEMGETSVGPTVTQFTFKPSEGVKLTRITALHNDLALALAAHPIRIEAPIPGKSLVGIEVPNKSVAMVGLREMLESRRYRERQKQLLIPFPLGKDVSGAPSIADLARMPHMLVAGATGAGKSVCLNILITSLLYHHGPDDLKFVLVDPKRVEFPAYNGIPHLITPVITKVDETVNALKWTIREMDRRFDILSKFGARDIASYNQRSKDALPYIVFIVDELADLMVTSAAEVEGPIVRLAQMSRAVGIHLVLATQRPSVDVLTGLIKANVPARIAFSVASQTDSRTILDQGGAEKLLGRGDMLYQTAEMAAPRRVQGAFVAEEEVKRVVDFLKSHYGPPDYEEAVTERQGGGVVFGGGSSDESDPLLEEAMEEIVRAGKASASLLQRRLKVGYARAARILDLLEQAGYIGPGEGAKPREILKADFNAAPPASMRAPAAEPDPEDPEEDEDDGGSDRDADPAFGDEDDESDEESEEERK
jgi:S-DNA-T family DNA segregation ATPase FtsK/SpoIIIE